MASQILWTAGQSSEPAAFLEQVLPWVLAAANADFAAVVNASHGAWSEVAAAGSHQKPPAVLLAEALDREQLVRADPWLAAPLEAKAASAELLLLHLAPAPRGARSSNVGRTRDPSPVGRTSSPSSIEETFSPSLDGPEVHPTDDGPQVRPTFVAHGDQIAASLAAVCGQGLATVRERDRQRRRIERLEAILDIAGRWNQNQQTESLLVEMAEAAARLLHADRASIFLWDRHSHTLVGRPALGVGKEELRVPDNSGIVGRVMQTGLPHRVDLTDDHEQINRQVDAQLHYRTRTLLCVPLRSRRGELFGVFETINKRDGNFSEDDEATLVEFAAQAAIALENAQERQALLQSRRLIAEQASQGVRLIGENPAIEALRTTIGRVAKTDLAVLILGENGTGKEVVSQSIHYQSARRDQPFIAVNCAAISETLLESELFGHEKGAFTDAHETRAGKFELASGGTLFLDEIGDLSPSGQAKLLRVLEEKIVVRVGGSKPIHTDARVIAATNQDLAEMAGQKKFRQDLYFRLNVVALQIPPLRERREDILVLAQHFLGDFCHKARRKPIELSAGARRKLEAHAWPGNVRELRNLMERLAYLAPADTIEADDAALILVPSGSGSAAVARGDLSLNEATAGFQSEYIEQAIASAGGNMNEAARRLGVHRSNLYRKMRLLGMQLGD